MTQQVGKGNRGERRDVQRIAGWGGRGVVVREGKGKGSGERKGKGHSVFGGASHPV